MLIIEWVWLEYKIKQAILLFTPAVMEIILHCCYFIDGIYLYSRHIWKVI